MLKRVASLLMCALFVITSLLLVSCNDEVTEESKAGTGGTTTDESFKNPQKDWGGEVITILTYNTGEFLFHTTQVAAEAQTGEAVNDAFYERNALIEEQYGLKIEAYVPDAGTDYITLLKNSVLAGDTDYDAVVSPLFYIAPVITEDVLLDMNSVDNDYLHLNEEWWDQTLMTQTSVNGNVYFVGGDALVEDDEATWAIFFNKDMYKTNAELEAVHGSLYDIVKSGNWTLDLMYEMVASVNYSTGAEKVFNSNSEDQWGMVAQLLDFYLFMQGCEQTIVDNTGDRPVLRGDEEVNINTFMEVANMLLDADHVGVADHHMTWAEGPYQHKRQIFGNGNALFMPNQLAVIGMSEINEAEINYGILPMPKRDLTQDEYTSPVEIYHCAVMAIPTTNVGDSLAATCYALEAMAYYGNKLVNPEYYERTLTYRRFQDDESGEMLDLIFDNRTYDLGAIFNFNGGEGTSGTLGFYSGLFMDSKTDITSTWESSVASFQSGLDSLIEKCYGNK